MNLADFAKHGTAVAARLHQLRPTLPVLLTTGYVADTLRAEAQLVGVCHVMHKEYTLEQLAPLLHRVLEKGDA